LSLLWLVWSMSTSYGPVIMAIDPTEKNARRLVNLMAKHSSGRTCEDLNQEFQRVTKLQRQSFFNALKLCRKMGWVTGAGGRDQLYFLDPSGSWKPPTASSGVKAVPSEAEQTRLEYLVDTQAGEIQELRDEVETLRSWASGGNGVAVSNLVQIVGDSSASPRQRLRAASVILGYRVQDPAVREFTKAFLETLSGSADNLDYRIEASELLRRAEDVKLSPAIERPDYTPARTDTPAEIAERHARQLKHIEEQAQRNAEEMAQERERFRST
jgi:hypothetical protein